MSELLAEKLPSSLELLRLSCCFRRRLGWSEMRTVEYVTEDWPDVSGVAAAVEASRDRGPEESARRAESVIVWSPDLLMGTSLSFSCSSVTGRGFSMISTSQMLSETSSSGQEVRPSKWGNRFSMVSICKKKETDLFWKCTNQYVLNVLNPFLLPA